HRRLISCIRSCVHMSWRPPTPAPFPYATLFRSKLVRCHILRVEGRGGLLRTLLTLALPTPPQPAFPEPPPAAARPPGPSHTPQRSEEHTSELQSRENLVCRLLLENKKLSQKRSK